MLDPQVICSLLFKCLNIRAKNKLRRIQGTQKCGFQLGLEIAVLRDQIDHGNTHDVPFNVSIF